MVVINQITERIIRAAMAVHSALGPGLLEKAYDVCLFYELSRAGLQFEHQLKLPVTYREVRLDAGFRIDYLVENCVIINFNVVHLRDGIRRVANGYDPNQPIDPLRSLRPLR